MLKFVFMLALLAGVAWFGSTVKLGSQTLFGHLQAIGSTKETKDLVEGTKQSAKPLVDDVRRRIAGTADPGPKTAAGDEAPPALSPDAGPPQEKISSADRKKLRRILGDADHANVHR